MFRASLAVLAIGGLLVSSCERTGPASSTRDEPAATRPGPALENELIPLRIERVDRPDRLPPAAEEGPSGLTELPDPAQPGAAPAEDREASLLEPGADWETESFSEKALQQLKRLAASPKVGGWNALLAPTFQASTLQPGPLVTVFRHGPLEVRRPSSKNQEPGPPVIAGGEDLAQALATLLGRESASPPARIEFKVYSIELPPSGDTFSTKVLAEVVGPVTASGSRQTNAVWSCTWTRPNPDTHPDPLLLAIRVEDYEEVTLRLQAPDGGPTPTLFADATGEVLGHLPHYPAQIGQGIEFWAQRLTRYGDLYQTGHHGIAVGDVNGDGLEDLYACDGGSLPNRLYLQNPDGTVSDASAASGVDFLEDSRGALLVDLDNDGDLDLVIATVAMIAFLENDGTGVFTLRGGHGGAPYPASLSAADYDNDSDLDLYLCVYEAGNSATGARWFEAGAPLPFHDAQNGGRNVLLENLGAFAFADRTDDVGLGENNHRWSFAAAWEDYDQDGDADLYVANDFGRNNLYRNDPAPGGSRRFTDIAAAAGVEDIAAGMSVAWGDANGDGRMDLYVGNMFSAAGNRVAYQRQFETGRTPDQLAGTRRMARGNTLFQADPRTGRFTDVSEAAKVTMGRWAWSSAFADINNDGWQDLVIANGYLTNTRQSDL